MADGGKTTTEVDGRRLRLSNLDKVMYPEAGFTKGQVVEYYAKIAPVMIPHLRARPVTFRRYPNGVDGESFFEKRCPSHRPDWVHTAIGPGSRRGPVRYCTLDDRPSLVWAANLAALELHPSLARAGALEVPSFVVFDLDPGPPAAMVECARVALAIRELLDELGLVAFPKTSGSKGLQLYLPLNTPHDYEHTSSFVLALAQLLERGAGGAVTTVMARSAREGRVLVDWSQNSFHKTTVCAYSLRARPRPTVSTPVGWDEVEAAAAGRVLSFDAGEVLERVEERGDLFEPVLVLEQRLPEPRG